MIETVLIVGSGPVGLTLALELTRYGVPVRLIDKMSARGTTSRALGIWSRTLELLDRAGVSGDLVAAGNPVFAANIVAGQEPIAHVPLKDIVSPYPFLLILPQSDTEALLERHLERLGVGTEMGVGLAGFTQDRDGVTATLTHPDGRGEQARFAWMVGCDGAHSTVRHTLELPFAGDTIDEDWVLGDFLMEGFPFPEHEIATYWHEEGPLVFFPIGPGRFRIIGSLGPSGAEMPAAPTPAAFQALIDRRGPGGITLKEPVWISVFRINERLVSRYRMGRVFLAGDAAHVHSPAGGQGMNTGMQDAINLAWKLALVCRGMARAPALLDSYDTERRAVGAEVVAAAGHMTSVIMMRNPLVQHIRNAVLHVILGLKPVQHAMERAMAEIATHYALSPLNGPATGPSQRPGTRVAPLPDEQPYGAGALPLFTVHTDAVAGMPPPAAFGRLIAPQVRSGMPGTGIALVRPDGYLAMSADAGNWLAVEAYLDRLIAPPAAGMDTVLSGTAP